MGEDDSPGRGDQPVRRSDNFPMVEVPSMPITPRHKKPSFFIRNVKAIFAVTLLISFLAILLLSLGVAGVLDPKKAQETSSEAPSTKRPVTNAPVTTHAPVTHSPVTQVPATAAPVTYPTVPNPTVPITSQARIECLPDAATSVTDQQCYRAGVCSFERLEGGLTSCYVNPELSGFSLRNVTPVAGSGGMANSWLFDLTRVQQAAQAAGRDKRAAADAGTTAKGLYSTPFGAPQLRVLKKSQSTLQFKVGHPKCFI